MVALLRLVADVFLLRGGELFPWADSSEDSRLRDGSSKGVLDVLPLEVVWSFSEVYVVLVSRVQFFLLFNQHQVLCQCKMIMGSPPGHSVCSVRVAIAGSTLNLTRGFSSLPPRRFSFVHAQFQVRWKATLRTGY